MCGRPYLASFHFRPNRLPFTGPSWQRVTAMKVNAKNPMIKVVSKCNVPCPFSFNRAKNNRITDKTRIEKQGPYSPPKTNRKGTTSNTPDKLAAPHYSKGCMKDFAEFLLNSFHRNRILINQILQFPTWKIITNREPKYIAHSALYIKNRVWDPEKVIKLEKFWL